MFKLWLLQYKQPSFTLPWCLEIISLDEAVGLHVNWFIFYASPTIQHPVHVGCFITCVIPPYSLAKTEGQYCRWNFLISERSSLWKYIKVSYSPANCAVLLPYLLIKLVEWSWQRQAPGTSLQRPAIPPVCFSLEQPSRNDLYHKCSLLGGKSASWYFWTGQSRCSTFPFFFGIRWWISPDTLPQFLTEAINES